MVVIANKEISFLQRVRFKVSRNVSGVHFEVQLVSRVGSALGVSLFNGSFDSHHVW